MGTQGTADEKRRMRALLCDASIDVTKAAERLAKCLVIMEADNTEYEILSKMCEYSKIMYLHINYIYERLLD